MTGDRMAMSLMYGLGGVPSTIQGPFGGIRIGDHVVRWGPSITGDGLDAGVLTQSEIDARLKLWDQAQEMRKKPGQESFYLSKTATCIGVRETRRIIVEYVVTEKDAIEGTHFRDVIAISSNPMPEYHGRQYFFKQVQPFHILQPWRQICM